MAVAILPLQRMKPLFIFFNDETFFFFKAQSELFWAVSVQVS